MERYNNLVRLLPDALFIHDERRIFYCNESALHLVGINDPFEFREMPILDLIPPGVKFAFLSFIKKTLEEDMDRNYLQSKLLCKNGEIKDVEVISTKYNIDGQRALLSVVRDVTPFKKINELKEDIEKSRELLDNTLEYDRLKTEFFSNISHEFRTPLNVILSALQLIKLQKDKTCENINEFKYFKVIRQNCLRLLRLVNNLIDITKIDSNFFEIRLQNCDIVELVESITMSVVEYARYRDITIVFDTNCEEKAMACDPDQIERIILNLLSNAIKFTQPGGNIWVNLFDYGEKIEIAIKDTGIGIPPEKQKYIFERFRKAETRLNRRFQGSGIGLSLVQALVEKHKGKITLNSAPGKGSEFIVELPCSLLMDTKDEPIIRYDCNNPNYVEKISIEFSDIYL